MAVQLLGRLDSGVFAGLSSDTKPTDGVGLLSRFFETDTKLWFFWDGSSWDFETGAPVYLATRPGEDRTNNVVVAELGQYDYETVAASQTNQVLGDTGGIGDQLHALWIVPATTSPGAVSIKDGSGSSVTVFTGGASSVADLKPFKAALPEDATSKVGGWRVTTGANVSVIASGRFTA